MSIATTLRALGRPLDDRVSLGRTLDELLAACPEPPALLGLGEPTHGIAAFPLLRNDILAHLVQRGFRSIALEIDLFAATRVDDYVCGATADIDEVLAGGFSHGFGAVPGNRELVEWLRAYNIGRSPGDRVHCYGFDAPMEISAAPSPRHALTVVAGFLPAALRPESAADIDALAGADADWTNEAAMFDPAASVGHSDRARALRIVADDLASALHRAGPSLRPADPAAYDRAADHARTAPGLLRYHAAMATPSADRLADLLSLRAEMMAENLLAIVERERHRGPALVFAHNAHLQRAHSPGEDAPGWGGAGALVALTLGARYTVVTTDGAPATDPATLQGVLAQATTRRTLFPTSELRAHLSPALATGEPIVLGHIPLRRADLDTADATVFITDTDGKQVRYW